MYSIPVLSTIDIRATSFTMICQANSLPIDAGCFVDIEKAYIRETSTLNPLNPVITLSRLTLVVLSILKRSTFERPVL